jgi:NADPH2:quinone reductase
MLPATAPAGALPRTMPAMGFDRHGASERPALRELPVPTPGPGQLLVRLHAAGVGHWDRLERDGVFARRSSRPARFPLVTGAEGAGVVVAAGPGAGDFQAGERVYGLLLRHAGEPGTHAGFALFEGRLARRVPPWISMDQAAVLPVDGMVALRGLRDALAAGARDALVVFGASGGVGHLALQLARAMGLRTLAIASGPDGLRLAARLRADEVVDGRRRGFEREVARFAGTRALALLTAGGEAAARVVAAMPAGSRVAWPEGVGVAPAPRGGTGPGAYATRFEPALLDALHAHAIGNRLLPHVSRRFPLRALSRAFDAIAEHHLGRIAVLTA